MEAGVPFELSQAAARARFTAWCRCVAAANCEGSAETLTLLATRSQRRLAPSSLWDESNRECRAVAALLPFWAFDAVADVRYRGALRRDNPMRRPVLTRHACA